MPAIKSLSTSWNVCKPFRTTLLATASSKITQASIATSSRRRSVEDEEARILSDQPLKETIRHALFSLADEYDVRIPEAYVTDSDDIRLPRAAQARFLAPLRRTPTHGIPVCNLQLRSFNARSVEFMADFSLRAAYYLNLPAKGPVPLPRITERMTVPRGHFVHKKSQENFERVTLRRLVQIQDGHPEVVQRWLAFIRKWTWYGVGMKADVREWDCTDTAAQMDANQAAVTKGIENVDWDLVGRRSGKEDAASIAKLLDDSGWGEATTSRSQPTGGR